MSLPKNCQLCQSDTSNQVVVTSHVFGAKNESSNAFYHCKSCDIYYQYPGLTIEEESQFYAKEFEKFMEERSGKKGGWQKASEHIEANEVSRKRRKKYLNQFINSKMDILEIGCSSGFMLYPLRENGHNCFGIEPSGVFSDFIASNKLPVYNSLDELILKEPDRKFDLIMHFFVLEHISKPIDFLEAQLNLLKPDGKIVFEIPNVADPLYTIYDIPAFERFYWSIAHPWYFSEKSLKYLLNKIGKPFDIILDQRYDLSNHIIWARDGVPGGLGRFTDILTKDFEDRYKKELIKIKKCDTLIGIISN